MNKIFIHSFIHSVLVNTVRGIRGVSAEEKKKDTVGRIRRKERLKPGKHDP